MVPNPVRLWKEQGESACTVCRLHRRCVYLQTPDGSLQEICFDCFKALFGAYLRVVLEAFFADPECPGPEGAVERWHFNRAILQDCYVSGLESIRLRMYVTPTEARSSGLPSLEGAIRARCRSLRWVHGRDALLDPIIRKVLPK